MRHPQVAEVQLHLLAGPASATASSSAGATTSAHTAQPRSAPVPSNIRQLTDVSARNLQQYLSCNCRSGADGLTGFPDVSEPRSVSAEEGGTVGHCPVAGKLRPCRGAR